MKLPHKLKLKCGMIPDFFFNKQQLQMGIKTEMEHTAVPRISKMIAKAHLVEDPKYYTHLKAMEKKYAHESRALRKKC